MAVSQKIIIRRPLPPYPSIRPDTVDVALHLAVQPSGNLCTTRQGLRVRRTGRHHDFAAAANMDSADSTSQMSKS